jgi:hypothetical protein
MLPDGLSFQSPDNMPSCDLFALATHVHNLQNSNSTSADSCNPIRFNFRSKEDIRAARQARIIDQVPPEIEEDHELDLPSSPTPSNTPDRQAGLAGSATRDDNGDM